jgi:L-ribulose-5-phosphate 3-epimerase
MELSVITDEISEDIVHALDVCDEMGVRAVELRSVAGANVAEHPPDSLEALSAEIDRRGSRVSAIASSYLKCGVGPEIRGSGGELHDTPARARDEQSTVLAGAIRAAQATGAPMLRAFSFWREADPAAVRPEITKTLRDASTSAGDAGLMLGLENEHECNVATSAEAADVLRELPSATVGLIWDPANAAKLTPQAFLEDPLGGFSEVRGWVIHVHVKDVNEHGEWVPLGEGLVDHVALLRELDVARYERFVSVETHYRVDGSGERATRDCIRTLREMAQEAGVELHPTE